MKHKILVTIGSAVGLIILVGGFFAWRMGVFTTADLEHPAKFIQADFIDLAKIGSISKYRSGEGHDFSGNGETCRSMKHYFTPIERSLQAATQKNDGGEKDLPPAPTPDTEVAIYSPVDGTIIRIDKEHTPIGEQIHIVPDGYSGYDIRLFHVYKDTGVKAGLKVKAGQRIGSISELSGTDISVGNRLGNKFISYFEVMPDSVFAAYLARGAASRTDFIFTKEFRDAHPFRCNGEEFAENYSGAEGNTQDVFLNGWTPPSQYIQTPDATMPTGQDASNSNASQSGDTRPGDTQPGNSNGSANTGVSTPAPEPEPEPYTPPAYY